MGRKKKGIPSSGFELGTLSITSWSATTTLWGMAAELHIFMLYKSLRSTYTHAACSIHARSMQRQLVAAGSLYMLLSFFRKFVRALNAVYYTRRLCLRTAWYRILKGYTQQLVMLVILTPSFIWFYVFFLFMTSYITADVNEIHLMKCLHHCYINLVLKKILWRGEFNKIFEELLNTLSFIFFTLDFGRQVTKLLKEWKTE